MTRLKRAPLLIGAAVVLPILIFLGLQLAFTARDQRAAAEREVLQRTEAMIAEVDGALQRTLGAIDVLSSARSVGQRDWQSFYERLQQVRSGEADWVTVALIDVATGRTLLDLRRPYGAALGGLELPVPRNRPDQRRAFAGGVGGAGGGCPCALAHRFISEGGRPRYLMTVAINPLPFQRLLLRETEAGRVGGLFDRDGRFIARTIDFRRRIGTPGTSYVQRAIRTARSGIYRGRTWEGFESYTAFATSPLSGWSAHIAFSTRLIDSPRWRSLGGTGIAALASLALALGLVWLTSRQIAEGRRVLERLEEAQKMEALGQLTGGIAHDFNNLMTPILGGLDLLSRKETLDSRTRRLVDGALASARKAAKLSEQLLAFSRRQRIERAPVLVARMLAELRPLLEQSVGEGISILIEVENDSLCVESDANQLQLALLNLTLNARDAMPEGGTVTIRAHADAPPTAGPAMVTIAVCDTGFGMPPEIQRRASEPFFTTKQAGQGTGLGLAQVHGIVHQSGGTMSIESASGRGTCVTLRLPACDPPPAITAPAAAAEALDGAGRRVVVCDDDDDVRTFISRVLEEAGYVVESVSDGRTAVEVVRNSEPALLAIDFAMQAMNGAEAIRAIRRFNRELPVLLITGYADSAALEEAAPDVPQLRKPFEAAALLAAVRDALGLRRP